jgi:hypothetical protein
VLCIIDFNSLFVFNLKKSIGPKIYFLILWNFFPTEGKESQADFNWNDLMCTGQIFENLRLSADLWTRHSCLVRLTLVKSVAFICEAWRTSKQFMCVVACGIEAIKCRHASFLNNFIPSEWNLCKDQGDRIGKSLARWVIVCFGHFSKFCTQVPKLFCYFST